MQHSIEEHAEIYMHTHSIPCKQWTIQQQSFIISLIWIFIRHEVYMFSGSSSSSLWTVSGVQLCPHTSSSKGALELQAWKQNKQGEARAVSAAIILTKSLFLGKKLMWSPLMWACFCVNGYLSVSWVNTRTLFWSRVTMMKDDYCLKLAKHPSFRD